MNLAVLMRTAGVQAEIVCAKILLFSGSANFFEFFRDVEVFFSRGRILCNVKKRHLSFLSKNFFVSLQQIC